MPRYQSVRESRSVLRGVPTLVVSEKLYTPPLRHDPEKEYSFRYRGKKHPSLPHVVKFSGGRSSGMLLFTLLENGVLDPDRGDVIVFNNTSSEHPDTYRFARKCKEASIRYGVPFFWVEFQTYEDARNGEWTRLPSYRLVNDRPKSSDNPNGFHWRGEVFEELLSWSGYVPNQFSRVCTQHLKLETTRLFLRDWLACKPVISRLGHHGKESRVDIATMYRRHRRNRGGVPKEIFSQKRAYALGRPHVRPEQRYSDYSLVWRPFENSFLKDRIFGDKASFGPGGVEYVSFIGLRGDEQHRVKRVEDRNRGPISSGYEGEHVYMPLAEMPVAREDVNLFWKDQDWDLELPREGNLSNCVYCFLKGVNVLRNIHRQMEEGKQDGVLDWEELVDTPSDISWWSRIEQTYGRDLEAENREITGKPRNNFVGFFGTSSMLSYEALKQCDDSDLVESSKTLIPCDCTD